MCSEVGTSALSDVCSSPCDAQRSYKTSLRILVAELLEGSAFPSVFPYFCQETDVCSERCIYFTFGMERAASWGEGFPLIPSARATAPCALLSCQPMEHLSGRRCKHAHGRALEAGFFAKSGFVSRRVRSLGYLNTWGPFPLVLALRSRKMQGVSKKGAFLLIFLLHWLHSGGEGTIPAAWASCSTPLWVWANSRLHTTDLGFNMWFKTKRDSPSQLDPAF